MDWGFFVVSLGLVAVSAAGVLYPYETTRFFLRTRASTAYPHNKQLEPSPKAVRDSRVFAAIGLALSLLALAMSVAA
ncbi:MULTISPECIES: hypothetical protein [Halorussus]|uniref:hypothetical protein n=1 Tax=Halorussus TaxID=1070314 RepID=UPI0020A18163|nr:hypothetical protein [Halorussus vallis]USZ76818.1 hypothetical protein NGM07_05690 [Halorussus vallis]